MKAKANSTMIGANSSKIHLVTYITIIDRLKIEYNNITYCLKIMAQEFISFQLFFTLVAKQYRCL